MKLFLRALSVVALTLVFCITLAWVVLPHRTATVLLTLNNLAAGLEEKTVRKDFGDIRYLEGGQGDTIVLVHGIYARKEHWVDLARHLVDDYHVIALDLPGFGDNAVLADADYRIGAQSKNLASVLDEIGLAQAHVAANSMGAYVSVVLARDRPDLFASLSFVGSPLGVPTPVKSDMDKALAEGDIPLLVQSNEDFDLRNAWLAPKIPFLPGPILQMWRADEVAMAAKNARIWEEVHSLSTEPTVLEIAPDLELESLIIWCHPDRIFHVSGAQALADALPRATLATLDDCGHLPMLDQTKTVAEKYLTFLNSLVTDATTQ